jgi:hypothetical protein
MNDFAGSLTGHLTPEGRTCTTLRASQATGQRMRADADRNSVIAVPGIHGTAMTD